MTRQNGKSFPIEIKILPKSAEFLIIKAPIRSFLTAGADDARLRPFSRPNATDRIPCHIHCFIHLWVRLMFHPQC